MSQLIPAMISERIISRPLELIAFPPYSSRYMTGMDMKSRQHVCRSSRKPDTQPYIFVSSCAPSNCSSRPQRIKFLTDALKARVFANAGVYSFVIAARAECG